MKINISVGGYSTVGKWLTIRKCKGLLVPVELWKEMIYANRTMKKMISASRAMRRWLVTVEDDYWL